MTLKKPDDRSKAFNNQIAKGINPNQIEHEGTQGAPVTWAMGPKTDPARVLLQFQMSIRSFSVEFNVEEARRLGMQLIRCSDMAAGNKILVAVPGGLKN